MLPRKALLKIIILLCFIVAFITITVVIRYGNYFSNRIKIKFRSSEDEENKKSYNEEDITTSNKLQFTRKHRLYYTKHRIAYVTSTRERKRPKYFKDSFLAVDLLVDPDKEKTTESDISVFRSPNRRNKFPKPEIFYANKRASKKLGFNLKIKTTDSNFATPTITSLESSFQVTSGDSPGNSDNSLLALPIIIKTTPKAAKPITDIIKQSVKTIAIIQYETPTPIPEKSLVTISPVNSGQPSGDQDNSDSELFVTRKASSKFFTKRKFKTKETNSDSVSPTAIIEKGGKTTSKVTSSHSLINRDKSTKLLSDVKTSLKPSKFSVVKRLKTDPTKLDFTMPTRTAQNILEANFPVTSRQPPGKLDNSVLNGRKSPKTGKSVLRRQKLKKPGFKPTIMLNSATPTVERDQKTTLKATTIQPTADPTEAFSLLPPSFSTVETGRRSKIRQKKNIYLKNVGNWSVYGDGSCHRNENQKIFDKLFSKWIQMAKESEIEFFLSCGTLLGSFRNGELIPHDQDMDILVNRKDFEKIKKYESRRNFTGYENDFHFAVQEDFYRPYSKRRRFTCDGKLTPEYRDHCSFQEPLGRLITENRHMDIYDYTEQGDKIWDPSEGGHKFKRSDIFPLQKCMLMGHETKCPNKPKEFLSQLYNNLSPLSLCKNGKWIKKKG